MRPSRLIALLVLVAALGSFIYFYERHQPTTAIRREMQDRVFPGLEQDSIERLSVRNPSGRFDLVRTGEEWRLSSPVEDRADSGSVSGLAWSLASLRAERVMDVHDQDLAIYGLAEPELEVTAWTRDGGERRLMVGDPLPLGGNRAAMTGDGRVVVVSEAIVGDLLRGLSDWRSAELTRVWEADVAGVTLKGEGRVLQLTRSQGLWTLTEPMEDIADRERAQGMLSDLSGARIREFLDEPGDLGALGLDPPVLEVTVTRRDDVSPVHLSFGRERTADGELQVACRRGDQVLWVDQSAVRRVTVAAEPWRSPRVVPFESWAAETVSFEAGADAVTLERDGFHWRSDGVEVDGEKVRDRLNVLSQMTVQAFDPVAERDDPLGRVSLATTDGARLEASFFSAGDQAAAVVTGRSGAMIVDAEAVRRLFEEISSLVRPLERVTSGGSGG